MDTSASLELSRPRGPSVISSLVVSVPEAAELLGLSDDLVYRLLDQGVLPELPRWSRRRLVPREAVDRIIEEAMAGFDPAIAAQLQSPSLSGHRHPLSVTDDWARTPSALRVVTRGIAMWSGATLDQPGGDPPRLSGMSKAAFSSTPRTARHGQQEDARSPAATSAALSVQVNHDVSDPTDQPLSTEAAPPAEGRKEPARMEVVETPRSTSHPDSAGWPS
jgi:excisionase family DNA binding protein